MTRIALRVLPRDVQRAVLTHARSDAPLECCGLLVGRGSTVVASVPMVNVAASPTRFQLDPGEHIALARSLRRFHPPLEIVGVYHSHPAGGATPSPADLAEACYPDWLYVVVGLGSTKPVMRVWRLDSPH